MMKKILVALFIAALAIPAMANVDITATDAGSQQLQISFAGPANAVRGIALTVSVTNGTIESGAFISSSFNTFVDYAFTTGATYEISMTGQHPFALDTAAGVATFPVASPFALSVGYLDQAGTKLGLTSGSVALIQISNIPNNESATVTISANATRGGAVVGEAPLGDVTIQPQVLIAGPVVVTETITGTMAVAVAPATAYLGQAQVFTASGVASSLGHALEYQFTDGSDVVLQAWSSAATMTKTYAAAGTYTVKAQARCAADTGVVSGIASTSAVVSECLKYNLTKKIGGLTDNVVNVADVQKLITYINAYKVSSSVWTVITTNPNYDARYNLATPAVINVADVQALIAYINANKISSSVWTVNCLVKP